MFVQDVTLNINNRNTRFITNSSNQISALLFT